MKLLEWLFVIAFVLFIMLCLAGVLALRCQFGAVC